LAELVVVKSFTPGLVARVNVKPGDKVENGAELVVLNVMKTEIPVHANTSGTVKEVYVKEWDEVDVGTPLVALEVA